MPVPTDRKYRDTHEWFKLDGNICTIGISQFAADELTDITYVELPKVGAQLKAESTFGEIESVKATGDLYTSVSGKVTAVNPRLGGEPELVNNDPFNEGWMIKVELSDPAELNGLMDAAAYEQHIGG